jgi:hypothetical protein
MTDTPQPSTPSRSRPLARAIKIGVALVVALGLAYGAASLLLARFLEPERLADWIEPRAAAAVNRDVQIGAVRIGFLPVSIQLRDVTVADPSGLAAELAYVEEVRLRVRLLPLLQRRVEVGELRLVSPRVALRAAADGTSNYADLSGEGPEGPDQDAAPVRLDLQQVRVEDGWLSYRSAGPGILDLTGLDMEATVQGGPEGWRFEGAGRASLSAEGDGVPPLSEVEATTRFDLSATDDFGTLDVNESSLRLAEAEVVVSGRIGRLKDPERTVDLTVRAEDLRLAHLLSALPDSVTQALPGPVDAGLAVDLRVVGDLGAEGRPDVSGSVAVTDGHMDGSGGDPIATGVAGTLDLHGDSVRVAALDGFVLDEPFSVTGVIDLGEGRPFTLDVAGGVDLARIDALSEAAQRLDAVGRVTARVLATGSAADPAATRLDGSAELDDVRLVHPALAVPVDIPSGTLRLDGQAVRLAELPVVLGQDRLSVTGVLRDWSAALDTARVPYFDGTVEGARLDLAALKGEEPPDTALTYGRVAFARVGGLSVAGRSPEDAAKELELARPDSLPLAGRLQLRIGVIEDPRYRLENVSALVELSPNLVRVSETRLDAFGGAIDATVDLALGAERDEQPFALTLSVRDVAAPGLLGLTTPLGPFVEGTLGLELQFAGTLDRLLLPGPRTLGGLGRVALTGGGLQAVPFLRELARLSGFPELTAPRIQDWDTPFALRDGAVVLSETTLRASSTEMLVGGTIGLGGSLDLRVGMDIPADRLDADALVSAGLGRDVLDRLQDRSEPIRTYFGIGGTLTAPSFTVDATSTGRAVTDAVSDEAEAQVQSELERQRKALEDRARGLFRGLVGGRDTASAVPPDTLSPAAGGEPDSARPDTTTAPDTTAADTTGIERRPR